MNEFKAVVIRMMENSQEMLEYQYSLDYTNFDKIQFIKGRINAFQLVVKSLEEME